MIRRSDCWASGDGALLLDVEAAAGELAPLRQSE